MTTIHLLVDGLRISPVSRVLLDTPISPRELAQRGLPAGLSRLVLGWEGIEQLKIVPPWEITDALMGPRSELCVAVSNVWSRGDAVELMERGLREDREKLLVGAPPLPIGAMMRRWNAERYFVWRHAWESVDERDAPAGFLTMEGVVWRYGSSCGGVAHCEPTHESVEFVGTQDFIMNLWKRILLVPQP